MNISRLVIALLTTFVLFGASFAVPIQAQSCEDFAQRQIRLSEKQLNRNNFSGALRPLEVAIKNDCRVASVRDQMASVLNTWLEAAFRSGSSRQVLQVIRTVSNQDGLSSEDRSELRARIRQAIENQITAAHRDDNHQRTYELCRTYPSYSDRTFTLNFICGEAAREVQALNAAISRYEWMVDNWTSNQSYLTRQDAFQRLKELYLITTRFDRGFEVAKRVAQNDPTPDNLLASLTAVRGRYLEPIARVAQQLFTGNPPQTARQHVAREMKSVKFPSYVESIYLMSTSGQAGSAFYGPDATAPPSASLIERDAGDVSLLLSTGETDRAWIVTRVDGQYFVLQFGQQTSPEENVILEGLLENAGDEERWTNLYNHEFTATYPATGSAVATLLGGAYLADASLAPYESIFDAMPVLQYFCIQNKQGGIVDSHAFSREQIQYDDGVWNRTSETPALFHHTVQRGEESLREVVWPTYEGETWSGVVRVGISNS